MKFVASNLIFRVPQILEPRLARAAATGGSPLAFLLYQCARAPGAGAWPPRCAVLCAHVRALTALPRPQTHTHTRALVCAPSPLARPAAKHAHTRARGCTPCACACSPTHVHVRARACGVAESAVRRCRACTYACVQALRHSWALSRAPGCQAGFFVLPRATYDNATDPSRRCLHSHGLNLCTILV